MKFVVHRSSSSAFEATEPPCPDARQVVLDPTLEPGEWGAVAWEVEVPDLAALLTLMASVRAPLIVSPGCSFYEGYSELTGLPVLEVYDDWRE